MSIVNPEVKVRFEHKSKAPVAIDVVDASLDKSCSDDNHDTDADEEVKELQKRLQKLQIHENNTHECVMVADLRCQLQEKEKSIIALEESIHLVGTSRAIYGCETRKYEIRD